MPELEFPKIKTHPSKALPGANFAAPLYLGAVPAFAEVCVTTNYTFLTGASHPEEYIVQAAALGYRALAVTDLHTLAGVVRAHVAAREAGVQFILGSALELRDVPGMRVCVYPTCMGAYRRLCRLLTIGKRRALKGECTLELADLRACGAEMLAVALPRGEIDDGFLAQLKRVREVFGADDLSLAACIRFGGDDAAHLEKLAHCARRAGVPLVASNDAHAHVVERRMLQDVLTCVRHGCTVGEAGRRLHANAERYLKPPAEMHRLFAAFPEALQRSVTIAERTRGFTLDELKYEYPDEVVPKGRSAQEHLTDLAWRGARRVYGAEIPARVAELLDHELTLIGELNYASYFLTVHDLVNFARTGVEDAAALDPDLIGVARAGWRPILCQGRGAAANSAVCFVLGVTAVDPTKIDLLFERFMSKERDEPPDIDIDFEHERREEVIQYLYRKYGRDRAALTAEVITYRRRSAIRDVGKALGLSLDLVDRLAKDTEWWDAETMNPARLAELGVNAADPTIRWLMHLVSEIMGFPRHLSQHVGGFVITRTPLCELVPVENAAMQDRTVIEWDKDDLDAVGMLKIDVLGLGMLTALERSLRMLDEHALETAPHNLRTITWNDPATYAMIQKADTIGVFQIESRAQMSMLPRLKPNCFYDLVIEVAIVRPGPIQGDMVHPYLRRRSGEEQPEYVHPSVEKVLKRTLGVPLFQEQCMALAVEAAGFTPGEADQLRRAMAAWKRKGDLIFRFGKKIISGMVANGIPREFAERCFEQIKGFSEYGFPESHAASFALLVYASSYMKCHHPGIFCAALLNSQPMGFYAPAQLVRDAREHGVEVRPIDVHRSRWDCTMEYDVPDRRCPAVRLGLRMVSGLGQDDAEKIVAAVARRGRMRSLVPLWRESGARAAALRRLARADAFRSMQLTRQQAQWDARLLHDEELPLFDSVVERRDPVLESAADGGALPRPTAEEHVKLDYHATGLSLKAHPLVFARPRLQRLGAVPCAWLKDALRTPEGAWTTVGGLVLVRQRPGSAEGVTFMTLEDETGIANLILWVRVYAKYRRQASARLVVARGRVQRQGSVVHVVVQSVRSLDEAIGSLKVESRDFR
ncbi:error-prone DNA polymerase [soil metagenome]